MIHKSAVISPCGVYRYELRRLWDAARPKVAFIGLNPSTADADLDDPTLRRCTAFARSWGYGELIMLNLFAFRATKPAELFRADDPFGPDIDDYLCRGLSVSSLVVACWGNHGVFRGAAESIRLHAGLHCLRLTQSGQPAHPLYLPGNLKPLPLTSPAGRSCV